MDEAYLLAQRANIVAVEAQIFGMVAENSHRTNTGYAIAYGEEAFAEKAEELQSIATMLMQNR